MLRGLFGGTKRSEVSPELIQAHRAYSAALYITAAEKYEALGRDAEKAGSPHAPWLYLQAARSNLHLDEVPLAMKQFERAISLLIAAGADDKAYIVGNQGMTLLHTRGREDEVQELADFMRFGLPGYRALAVSPEAHTSPVILQDCPACEGPIRPAEVRWKDLRTAECPYCGSTVPVLKKPAQKS